MDTKTKEERSFNMSHIKSSNTKPEEKVRKYLFSKGFRYRKNYSKLPGKPDIVLPKYRTVIFVNGCFWHKHDCSKFVWPSSNVEYWQKKITRNTERDHYIFTELKKMNWIVIVIWECEINNKRKFISTMNRLADSIKNS